MWQSWNSRPRAVQPGAERESRTLREDELFEPGRSVLTADGRQRLDEVAAWFKKVRRPESEVVIAAFTDDDRDPDLAQILTQEQADAVRKYLVDQHAIDSAGWFATRKVAAVGFGTAGPPHPRRATPTPAPAPRVEIILFTPAGVRASRSLNSSEQRDVHLVERRLDVLQEQEEIEDEEVVGVGHDGRVERREC